MTERVKVLIQGIILVMFGFLFMANPVVNTVMFTFIIGVIFVVVGAIQVIDGLVITKGLKYKVFRILEGLLLGAFGLIFFLRNPQNGVLIVVYGVIWMMIFLSIMNTVMVLSYDSRIRWFSIILNFFVIYFGIMALLDPSLAIVIFYWSVSLQLIFMGVNHISLYFMLPKDDNSLE